MTDSVQLTNDRENLAERLRDLRGRRELSSLGEPSRELAKLVAESAELVDDRSGRLGSRRSWHRTQSGFADVARWCSPTQSSTVHDDRPFLIAEANLSGLANSCVG